MTDIQSYLASVKSRVDLYIEEFYSSKKKNIPEQLYEAINYAIFPGGKMLRPAIAFGICDELGSTTDTVLPIASAIELVHTFSLIHDDLPCIDNDDYRRGRETVHKKFSEAIALLAGDALLIDAFGMVASAQQLTESKRVQILELFSSCAGSYGMVGGQILDIDYSSGQREIDPHLLITLKTSNMFILSSMCGAICSDKEFVKEDIIKFGEDFGTLFQLTDDILDFQQDRRGSFNIVTLKGHNEVFSEIDRRYENIRLFTKKYSFNLNIISGLTELVVNRVENIRQMGGLLQ